MMNKFKIKNLKLKISGKQKGFTVLESLVAIFILSLSISGVFTAVQRSLSQTIIAKDEVKAFYLAQEAIEIIRNKRDTNQLARINGNSIGTPWLSGLASGASDPCYFGDICMVDIVTFNPVNNTGFVKCGNIWGSCGQNLRQDPTTFLYQYSTGNPTNFSREIKLHQISAHEIVVTVRVSWSKGIFTRAYETKTHLFNLVPSN